MATQSGFSLMHQLSVVWLITLGLCLRSDSRIFLDSILNFVHESVFHEDLELVNCLLDSSY